VQQQFLSTFQTIEPPVACRSSREEYSCSSDRARRNSKLRTYPFSTSVLYTLTMP
jgi:hypothetical protein